MTVAGPVQPINREAIFAALFALVWAAYPWKNNQSLARRLLLWGDVPTEQRPALFQFEGTEETYSYSAGGGSQPKRVLEARLFIYTDCKVPSIIGSTILNTTITAVETALAPTFADSLGLGGQQQTLGGLVHSCRIEGKVFRDPGDIDGDGMARIPVMMVCP